MSRHLSVVIRCLNEEAHIGRLLVGIEQQRGVDTDVVVVDSGSTDSTLAIAGRFPVHIVHMEPARFSFGRSLNLGFKNAQADIVVVASAHVYPQRDDWLAQLVRPFADDSVALSYGRQVGAVSSAFSEQMIFERWYPPTSEAVQRHPFCNNANAAVRRSVWEGIRYDEELTGLEDLDWAKRAMASGHRVSYVAEAAVVHVHDQSPTQVVDRYRREAIAHRRIYHDQRMTSIEASALGIVNIFGDLLAARRQRSALRDAKAIVSFRTAQFLGTYRGFAHDGTVPDELKKRFYYPLSLRGAQTPSESTTGEAILYEPVTPSQTNGLVAG